MKTKSTATIIMSRDHAGREKGTVTKKLINKKGYTMVELLCALAVLILLTSCVTVGIGLATKSFENISRSTSAKELSGTISNLIADEIRYAVIKESGEGFTYNSMTQGHDSSIVCDGGKVYVVQDGEKWDIVSPQAYKNGCKVTAVNVTSDGDNTYTVSVTVSYPVSGKNVTLTEKTQVEAIRMKTTPTETKS